MDRKGRKRQGESQSADIRPLMVSLNLILLVFFVYINTIATIDIIKIKKAFDSLLGTFSVLSGGIQLDPGEQLAGPPQPISTPDDKDSKLNVRSLSQELGKIVRDLALQEKIIVSQQQRDLVIRMPDLTLFPSGSAELHGEAIELLRGVAAVLKESSLPLRVEGHTDDRPISTERFPSNWDLSAARAVSVLRFLAEDGGISRDRMTAVGYGKYRPLAPNDTPERRARNRRVNIVVIGGGAADDG